MSAENFSATDAEAASPGVYDPGVVDMARRNDAHWFDAYQRYAAKGAIGAELGQQVTAALVEMSSSRATEL